MSVMGISTNLVWRMDRRYHLPGPSTYLYAAEGLIVVAVTVRHILLFVVSQFVASALILGRVSLHLFSLHRSGKPASPCMRLRVFLD